MSTKLWRDLEPNEQALWGRLQAHPLERPEQGLDLVRRVAREQGWTLPEARAAVEEYRRFCLLACLSETPVTPSEDVDQVWHLHLTYSRDYWERWCGQALQRPLHHDPTPGGQAAGQTYVQQYAQTLALYERCFGPPPRRWWPASHRRFARPERWRWVDRQRYWLLPRPRHWGALLANRWPWLGLLLPASAMALPSNPLDWTAGPFLALFGLGGLLLWITTLILRHLASDTGAARGGQQLTAHEMAFLAGGSERLLDTTVAAALDDGTLQWDDASMVLRPTGQGSVSEHRDVLAAVRQGARPKRLARRLAPLRQRVQLELMRRGLVLDNAQAWKVQLWSALPLALWSGFGVAKIVTGLERDKPVGFLVILTILCAIATLTWLFKRPRFSKAGRVALAQARVQQSRAARAPRSGHGELAVAVALGGTVLLSGTAWAGYHQYRTPSGDGGGSGGDSDGGGGCGGGGCGGCGG
ncbi:MAG: TIGR04222 domain-containing membrane protein [Lysobacterales bacterium]